MSNVLLGDKATKLLGNPNSRRVYVGVIAGASRATLRQWLKAATTTAARNLIYSELQKRRPL